MNCKAVLSIFGLVGVLSCGAVAAEPDATKSGERRATVEKKNAANPGDARGFIPQPEPPGKAKTMVKPGEAQGFNPQPEPPGKAKHFKPGEAQGFNPQPEPPGDKQQALKIRS